MTQLEIVKLVIDNFEGHLYTDDPVDNGGATKYGVTLRTYSYWRQKYKGLGPASKADVAAMTFETACEVALDVFMRETGFRDLSRTPMTQLVVYDYSYHSGKRAVLDLQRVLNSLGLPAKVEEDGAFGPETKRAVALFSSLDLDFRLAVHLLTRREEFMQALMERNSTQRKYMLGWWKRTTKLQKYVLDIRG